MHQNLGNEIEGVAQIIVKNDLIKRIDRHNQKKLSASIILNNPIINDCIQKIELIDLNKINALLNEIRLTQDEYKELINQSKNSPLLLDILNKKSL